MPINPLVNPLALLAKQPAIAQHSLQLDNGLTIHYRHDLPGELSVPNGFSHHMLTFFLSKNEQQITHLDECGNYHGQMNPGDFYLYPAGISGRTSWDSEDKTLHIVMEPRFLNKVAADSECIGSGNFELLPVLKESDCTLKNLVQLLLACLNSNALGEKLYLESLSSLLGIHLLRQYCNSPLKIRQATAGLAPYQLKAILDYIQAHLSEELSLDTLSAQINLSRCHFAAQFKQSIGIPPHRYVSQQRIEKAKQLLRFSKESHSLPIADIALACGFANQSHLTTTFKKHSGTTPKAYQAQQ
jgi:AraC family transcriptional regulator